MNSYRKYISQLAIVSLETALSPMSKTSLYLPRMKCPLPYRKNCCLENATVCEKHSDLLPQRKLLLQQVLNQEAHIYVLSTDGGITVH